MKLELHGIGARLGGTTILDGVNLHVAEGEFVGLVGPNGSGKSTLLRTLYRSLRPTAGAAFIGGDDVWALSARAAARRTAAVLQGSPVPDGVTAAELVALGRTPHHGLFDRDNDHDRDVVRDALDRADAADLAERVVGGLSGGERQRVLLALALAQDPRTLLLDEPTNHLDIRARFHLLDTIRGLGLTTLAVLHDLDLAARTCDRIVVLDRGRIVAHGPVLDTLTPDVMRTVFGVNAETAPGPDGVVRITYAAQPLAAPDTP